MVTLPLRAADETELDPVSKKAAEIEAQLSKLRDSSPEAADALARLIDLYYSNGRVLGLVRAAETFVNKHPSHKLHHDVMLKLIEGQRTASRPKEAAATIRQFITRYPEAPEVAKQEELLGNLLLYTGDRGHAPEAFESAWHRAGGKPEGVGPGVGAIHWYLQQQNGPATIKAAQIADAMLETLPADEFAANVGWKAFHSWRSVNDFAKSNLSGSKMLAKGIPTSKPWLRELHQHMADNYNNLHQFANAVESVKKARELSDYFELHMKHVEYLHNAGAPPAEIEPVVRELMKNHPTRGEHYAAMVWLAEAYLKSPDREPGLKMLAKLLPIDARVQNAAKTYVQNVGNEKEQLEKTVAVLQDAIAKNPRDAYYLRHALATDVYRDRLKDPAAMRRHAARDSGDIAVERRAHPRCSPLAALQPGE